MASLVAVLDACVLIPASLRDILLRLAEAGFYRPVWSDAILEEVRRNLVAHIELSEQQARRVVDAMHRAFPEAAVTSYEQLIDRMTNAPTDRHVLGAAVAADADVIVTSNLRDFPESALRPYDVVARSPDDFLGRFVVLGPDRIADIVSEQAQALRTPPLPVDRLLRSLATSAPEFAGHIGELLRGRGL